ncbi:MAG TPA: triple tyrosine motif-containing protein, partial [Verrucomicrobiae bacterium]|nr:triple tyrosine motif-containing protein [Verrucomicrobiae bacterium]
LSPRLAGKAILGLCESTNGGLWIGTDGGGLGYVNKDVRRAWDVQDGLPDNVVWGLTEDDEANLWLATPRGLCRISSDSINRALARPEPLKVKLVYETDQSTPKALRFGGPHAIRSAGGRLWFALNSGPVGVDIRGRESDKPAPQVHIENLLVDNQPVKFSAEKPTLATSDAHADVLMLPGNPKTLEFHFVGLSFDAPEKVRFRHKMDGIDADWVQNGTERQIGYGPLPSGNYVFHVTACNAEGIWNDKGASLAFIIPTPLWRQPWALGMGGLTATFLVVGMVRVVSHRRLRWRLEHLEQQRAMERERIRIAQNMHDEIGSKLTKISYLSERAKTELRGAGKAEGKIDSIATTSRELLKALDEIVWAVNPKNDSLEHLAAYFCQYAREYFQDTTVECDIRMQSKLPEMEMSAEMRHNLFLAFEESLNNILKHAKASSLNMDISTDADRLRITIRDNGRGFEQKADSNGKATGGNGLRNIRHRMASVGGTCEVESAPGRGTCISLRVPLDSAKIRNR